MLSGQLTHRQKQCVTKTIMVLPRWKSNSIISSQDLTPGILVQSYSCMLPKKWAILIVLWENSSTTASSRKRQRNVYDSVIKLTKLIQKKLPTRWDALLEVGKSKYKKNTMTRQASNGRNRVVISVYLINFYNIQNLICLTPTARYATHDY